MSTAETAGAAPAGAADAPADSSTGTTTSDATDFSADAMAASLRRNREASKGTRDADGRLIREPKGQPPEATETEDTAVSRPSPDGKSLEGDEGKKTEDSVPLAAFKQRLNREVEKSRGLQEQLQAQRLEASEAAEAVRLLRSEIARLQGNLKSGQQFDERDEQVRAYELANEARAAQERIRVAHAEALQTQADEYETAATIEELRVEIGSALEAHPLVSEAELLKAMQANPEASADSIAAAIHEQRLKRAKQMIAPAPVAKAPSTARPSSTSAASALPNNAEGYAAWLRANKRE